MTLLLAAELILEDNGVDRKFGLVLLDRIRHNWEISYLKSVSLFLAQRTAKELEIITRGDQDEALKLLLDLEAPSLTHDILNDLFQETVENEFFT